MGRHDRAESEDVDVQKLTEGYEFKVDEFYEAKDVDDLNPEELALLIAGIDDEKECLACLGRGFKALAHSTETCEVCCGTGVVPI